MIQQWKHSGRLTDTPSSKEIEHGKLARRAAAEGCVLLKNEGILPFRISDPIALFGGGAGKTIKGGIGSGDVNNRKTVSIYEGLMEAGATITSTSWIEDYQKRYSDARNTWKEVILEAARHVENHFDAYAAHPFMMPEGRDILESDLSGASAAIYVVSRIAGEGKDRRLQEGDYYLSGKEKEDLLFLNRCHIPTVLIINAGGPVEITDILEEAVCIKAVLNVSQPGQEAGHAVADILFGKVSPSGRLTSTWARRYSDYPYSDSYSYLNGDLEKEEYKEGIYVGYRYFDSFEVEPLFPFGYGLSYTEFDTEFLDIEISDGKIRAKVRIKNTGMNYPGKEIVQIYITLPQNGEAREYQRLAGFAKTDVLAPGECQELTVEVDQSQLAVFSKKAQGWIVEAGYYGIWTGKSSADRKQQAFLVVEKEAMLCKTYPIGEKETDYVELLPPESLKARAEQWTRVGKQLNLPEYGFLPVKEVITQQECALADETYRTEDLIPLLYGNVTKGTSTLGSAGTRVPGSAGETSEELEKSAGIRSLIMADGPAGLRLRQCYQVDRKTDTVYGVGVLGTLENGFLEPMEYHEDADTYYQFCTAFPVGTALAQTWNLELIEEFGRAVAEEMREYYVDLWLAPGLNIHRNPLCGRNFEYYSEDPLVSGLVAAAVTDGVQSMSGCAVTIKHFACNNQEDNRMGVDSRVSEKALREIYLRGFEIAVKKSSPLAIMTSYNLVNGVHAAANYELCTTVAREEWGFRGLIMSDWNTTVPEDGTIPWQCAAAGNDVIMPGNMNDDVDIRRALEEGRLSENKIRMSAGRVISLVRKLDEKK